MATAPITPSQFPPAASALIAQRMLNKHSPREIADAVEILLDLLDLMGGDPDAEPDGTEEDTDGDERGDQSWPEWHTLAASDREGGVTLKSTANSTEDDEDDDPDTGVEDDPRGMDPEEDRCSADEDHFGTIVRYGMPVGAVEGEEWLVPAYAVDQSVPLALHGASEPVPDFQCGALRLGRPAD